MTQSEPADDDRQMSGCEDRDIGREHWGLDEDANEQQFGREQRLPGVRPGEPPFAIADKLFLMHQGDDQKPAREDEERRELFLVFRIAHEKRYRGGGECDQDLGPEGANVLAEDVDGFAHTQAAAFSRPARARATKISRRSMG